MPSLSVIPVQSRREKKQFLELPWRLYKGDEYWIPPLRGNQKELVNYTKHAFYEKNEIQTFLASRDGQPCGRVAAIVNYGHIERYNDRRGFFGFFECDDDHQIAAALFDAVKTWFAERDIVDFRGPMNPSMNYECGLLVEGFDSAPFFMMTYNKPYYGRLIEECGLCKVQDMYAFWGHVDMLAELDKKLEFVVKEATRRFGITIRPLNTRRFKEDVRIFLNIYNDSLQGTWGFTPLSEGEIDHMASSMKHLIAPEMTCIAEVDGSPIGATFALLDYNPRIKKIDGKLFPFGFVRLLWNRRAIKRMRILSTNVVPEYQRWGIGLVVLNGVVPAVVEWGLEEGEFSWVLESNHLSYSTLKRGGAQITKTYRFYDYGPHEDETLKNFRSVAK